MLKRGICPLLTYTLYMYTHTCTCTCMFHVCSVETNYGASVLLCAVRMNAMIIYDSCSKLKVSKVKDSCPFIYHE